MPARFSRCNPLWRKTACQDTWIGDCQLWQSNTEAQPRLRSWRWGWCSLWFFYLTALSGILFHLQHPISSWNAWFLEIQDQICISALLLLLSVSLLVLLAFLENKNCASFHIPNVEKGLDVCGTLIFPVTCWLSFPFFQRPSSPPTLSCPQTSPPSLWVLTWQSGEVSSFWYTGPFLPKITAALSKVFQN